MEFGVRLLFRWEEFGRVGPAPLSLHAGVISLKRKTSEKDAAVFSVWMPKGLAGSRETILRDGRKKKGRRGAAVCACQVTLSGEELSVLRMSHKKEKAVCPPGHPFLLLA